MSWLLSQVYDFALRGAERKHFAAWRQETLAEVAGDVIEIGAGTGANFPHYHSGVTQLLALEPSDARNRKRQHRYQPLWGLVSASCQVVRDTEQTIRDGSFRIDAIEHTRMEVGPRIVRPVIRGWATRI